MTKLLLTSVSSSSLLSYSVSNDTWKYNKEDIKLKTALIFPGTLKTGWGAFTPGAPPDWQWDEAIGKPGKPPTDEHKRCFSIEVETEENGKMTWSGAGYGQCAALEELMEDISTSECGHPGKVPVVEYTGSEVKKVGKGSTRIPKFNIVDWVDPAFPPWVSDKAPF